MSHRVYDDLCGNGDDRQLDAARDRSIANLRRVADHRRVELLARNIHASLLAENLADGILALVNVLGSQLRAMSPEQQITAIAILSSLLTDEILGTDGTDA